VKSAARLSGNRNPGELLNHAELERADPEVVFVYFYGLWVAWFILGPLWGVAFTGFVATAASVGSDEARTVSTGVLIFGMVFCFAGGVDAGWRYWLAYNARRRYRSNGRIVDEQVGRLMKFVQFDDQTLLLQVAAGITAVVILR
jgi:hypothetical protein